MDTNPLQDSELKDVSSDSSKPESTAQAEVPATAPGGERENAHDDESNTFTGPRAVLRRGTPNFRISAHHGMRPGNVAVGVAEANDREPVRDPTAEEESSSKTLSWTNDATGRRGRPNFRISAHHGMRPGRGTLGNLEAGEHESVPDLTSEVRSLSTTLSPTGVSGRGVPAFRISAHHGMRPGSTAVPRNPADETADPNKDDEA